MRNADIRQNMDEMRDRLHPRGKLTALGACIFGGGFSLGVEEAGFQVAGHLELPDLDLGSVPSRQRWPVAVAPLDSAYRHRGKSDGSDGETWKGFARSIMGAGTVPDFLYANPPCVAYAGTGKHLGTGDERMCYLRYCAYELAMTLRPKVWAWELVPGIFAKERGFLDAMAFRASRQGYRCYVFLTTSAIHGGYQDRRRFHFVASKVDLDFQGVHDREPPSRRGVRVLDDALDVVRDARSTVYALSTRYESRTPQGAAEAREGLGVLPNDSNIYSGAFSAIMPFCPPGSHLRDVHESTYREHYKPRGVAWDGGGVPGFAHTRGRMDRPSPNVLGGHTIIHPTLDRYLTPREVATVMGFPTDYAFTNGSKAYAEIGKGLCTHNAAFLARVVHDGLTRGVPVPAEPAPDLTVIDWRERGIRLSLKMDQADRNRWWESRHGTPAPEGTWG